MQNKKKKKIPQNLSFWWDKNLYENEHMSS